MYIGDNFINPLAVVDWYFETSFLGNRYIHINYVNGHFIEIYTDRWATGIHLDEEEIDRKLKEAILNARK